MKFFYKLSGIFVLILLFFSLISYYTIQQDTEIVEYPPRLSPCPDGYTYTDNKLCKKPDSVSEVPECSINKKLIKNKEKDTFKNNKSANANCKAYNFTNTSKCQKKMWLEQQLAYGENVSWDGLNNFDSSKCEEYSEGLFPKYNSYIDYSQFKPFSEKEEKLVRQNLSYLYFLFLLMAFTIIIFILARVFNFNRDPREILEQFRNSFTRH